MANNGDVYRCRDFYEAAYLIERGIPLVDVQASAGSRWVDFIFPAFGRAVAETFGGDDLVNARQYGYTLRELKNRMHAAKGRR